MDWTNETELRQTGCVYQYRGVLCQDKTKCSVCGWNPSVEAERKKYIRERRDKEMGWGVHDYPEPPRSWQEEHYEDDDGYDYDYDEYDECDDYEEDERYDG